MPGEWKGPTQLELHLFDEHVKTIRYRGSCKNQHFDFYVPKSLLPANDSSKWPDKINAVLMKTDLQKQELGFLGKPIAPRAEQDFWEFDFLKKNVNSIRYAAKFEGQTYSLYAPNAIFGDLSFPDRLLVYVTVPD